ncbi:SUR7/PalI family-domain-containing protein [Amylocarpus encephaloides]|uniref:SUR7/PalI family-domain-containing protein n=1 Tax=Amylocarpus encephaloides TaxID=45428 RepID=A0A9P8CBU4_9HELO|nr:SUR7/PalI family-domain-containing protein [Amylocarpus encephaloides]
MVLPPFKTMSARRREKQEEKAAVAARREPGVVVPGDGHRAESSDRTLTPNYASDLVDPRRATRTRKNWILLSCFCFFVSVIFIILVEIGNLSNRPVLRSTYFFKLNLSNIIPVSTPDDIVFVNSLARSLGLHDFYQVGLWGVCEGYNNEGITYCSTPQTLFWFNPVEILLSELFAGATIPLPSKINDILSLIRIISHLMSGFFLTGVCMNFVSIFLAPITLYSRWWSLPFAIWTFIAALLTTAATIAATVMFIIFRDVATSQDSLNIGASVGTQMYALMWVGAVFSIFGFLIHLLMSCCCASRRDVRTARRRGSKKAYSGHVSEKQTSRKRWNSRSLFRRKSSADV